MSETHEMTWSVRIARITDCTCERCKHQWTEMNLMTSDGRSVGPMEKKTWERVSGNGARLTHFYHTERTDAMCFRCIGQEDLQPVPTYTPAQRTPSPKDSAPRKPIKDLLLGD